MKIGAVTGYKTNFGYNNDKQQVQNPVQQEANSKMVVNSPVIPVGPQPLAGLISPQTPLPTIPVVTPPIGGLITPPKRPNNPLPTVTPPIGGLITPPKRPNIPQIPVVTAGLISPEKTKEIKKEIAKTDKKQ